VQLWSAGDPEQKHGGTALLRPDCSGFVRPLLSQSVDEGDEVGAAVSVAACVRFAAAVCPAAAITVID
jgi:hypothetical protein